MRNLRHLSMFALVATPVLAFATGADAAKKKSRGKAIVGATVKECFSKKNGTLRLTYNSGRWLVRKGSPLQEARAEGDR